ncbi:acetoacetyl-CoA reductase [Nocardiopsis coralliicola]
MTPGAPARPAKTDPTTTEREAPMSGVAVVTGGERGIGAAIADALAGDGWTVVSADRTVAAPAPEQTGPGRYRVGLDVTDEDAVEQVFDAVEATAGPVMALVNNAGITSDKTIHKMTLEQWRSVMAVNLDGPFLTTRALARRLRARTAADGTADASGADGGGGGARVVNISSIAGKLGNFGQANYSSSKYGLIAFTKVAARELARYGTVNAVMPGAVATDMTAAMPQDILAERVAAVPLRRFGATGEIAEAVRWLCSPGAAYLTGTVLEVTGGRGM